MLKIRELSTGYGESQVIFGSSLEVERQKVTALVGSNAAGKTTLLNTISGINKPWGGEMEFLGENITHFSPRQRVEMGLIQCPEGRRLFPTLSVYENILLGAYPRRAQAKKEKNLKQMLEAFPILGQRRSQPAGLLSGGEQQMCAIARALMSDPVLLIMDEPSLGLAPIIVSQVFEIIKTVQMEGVTVFLVEQNVQKALELASFGYVMENGKITLSGSGRELLGNDDLRRTYLGI
ncbi:MAG: ABC transporter ATP-binding protein [Synergistaceae bacterium]|jgi:branched-chain amino acid transport system ATP-binding protein|nr:ABC transporter ATP-binding protein [Synergistaceae bacterium]